MALVTLASQLSQGTSSAETLAWTSSAGAVTTITGTGLPAIAAGEFFQIRDHSQAENNGLYYETGGTPLTTSVTATKISGANPTNQTSEAVLWLGDSNTEALNVMFDTAAKKIYLVEQAALDVAGVGLDIVYKFAKEEWKDDDYLNSFSFPIFAIDTDAGKYIVGTDGSNNNGWNWIDVGAPVIRTRKLIRSAGWEEQDASAVVLSQWAGIQTLGSFEDSVNDNAYYQFGTDTTVDDTVNFDFNGPVNEAILCFEEQAQPGSLAITTTTVTRTGGSFITEGYKVGGAVTIRSAEDAGNDATFVLTAVTALILTTTGLTANVADTTAILSVDNRSAFATRLRVRDGDANGKTFGSSNLAAAGESTLGNRLFKFPLSNVTDLKISATDVAIDSDSNGIPDGNYAGMTITYFAAPQSIAGYVGGSYNFGIGINANSGTAQEVYEFVQWALRSNGGHGSVKDIDNDASTAIGRAMDALLVFEGDTLISGKTIPINPDGGGTGVYISNIAAADKNNVKNYDNTGVERSFPETISVTLDFNSALISDTVATYDLYFDRTIQTTTDATFVLTAGTGASGTFVSTAQMPTLNVGAGQFVTVKGLTGADVAMNGVYQVDTETSTSSWAVTRWDNTTIVTAAGTAVTIDQYGIDTPDAIVVQDDVPANVSGLASADYAFSFDFDGNVQGGRTVSTTTFVVARAQGISGAQYVQSSVQSIVTGTPLTIVLTASNELNVA